MSGKPTMDSMTVCNNVGLISKGSEDIASESTENSCGRQALYGLTLPLKGTPANIRTNLTLPTTRDIGLHSVDDSRPMCLSSFSSERRMFCAIECVTDVQGHPRSLILAPFERAHTTFYLSLIVALVLSCTVSEIRRLIG